MFSAFRYVLKCDSAQSEGTSRKEHEMRRQHTESPHLYKCFRNGGGLPRCSHGPTLGSSADLKRYLQEIGTGEETYPKGLVNGRKQMHFFRDHLTPRAYREETAEGMNTVLCNGIYEYIACRSENKIPLVNAKHCGASLS